MLLSISLVVSVLLCFFLNISDFLFKFLVIGSAGTGKSCILHQFIENKCECLVTSENQTSCCRDHFR